MKCNAARSKGKGDGSTIQRVGMFRWVFKQKASMGALLKHEVWADHSS